MSSNLEKEKIAKTLGEAKARLKNIKPEKINTNTRKAKVKRGY